MTMPRATRYPASAYRIAVSRASSLRCPGRFRVADDSRARTSAVGCWRDRAHARPRAGGARLAMRGRGHAGARMLAHNPAARARWQHGHPLYAGGCHGIPPLLHRWVRPGDWDLHYAQGDGEVAGTAIEMDGSITVTARIVDNPPDLTHGPHYEGPARLLDIPSRRFHAVHGFSVQERR